MALSEYLPISGAWWIDILVAAIVAMVLLYLARQTAHEIIGGASRSLASILRVAARAIQLCADQLQRNARHGALLLMAEHQERLATRELSNLRKEVQVGLKRYPALRDAVNQNIERIESEYQASADRPAPPTAWRELIESVAGIRENSDPALKDTLESIRQTIEKASQRLTEQHQIQNRAAERSLARLEPRWSEAREELEAVNKTLKRLQERIDHSNRRIRRFETIHNQRRSRTARFHGWLTLNFVVGSFLLVVGLLIALVNFHLIHAPLEEAFGRQATTGPFRTAPLTATTLILAQLALAVVISDSARLSRLIAPVSRLRPLKRRITLAVASVLLVLLALSEASLAFMRDSIYLEAEWLARELEQGVAVGSPDLRWVPSLAQMGMGFVLPLTFIALVPALESFFQTARIALLTIIAFLTSLLGTICRLLSRLVSSAGQLLNYGYDLLIVIPLSIEQRFRRREPALDAEGGQ